jgi:Dual specificity phosphatase, catalytic domain/Rhodanese-like domain
MACIKKKLILVLLLPRAFDYIIYYFFLLVEDCLLIFGVWAGGLVPKAKNKTAAKFNGFFFSLWLPRPLSLKTVSAFYHFEQKLLPFTISMPVEGVCASPLTKLNTSTSSPTDSTQLMDKSISSHSNGVDSLTASFWQHTSLSDKEQASPKLQYSRRRLSSNDNAVIPMDIDHRSTPPPSTNVVMKDFLPNTNRTTVRVEPLDDADHTNGTQNDGPSKSLEYTDLGPQESSTPFDLHTINSIPCASNSTCATDQFHSPTNGVKLKRHSATTKPKPLSTTNMNKTSTTKSSVSPSQAKPMSAIELMTRLENVKRQKPGETMLLIDLRDINEYNEDTITGAINVNLPTLLIKRFKRNAMSTFKMQNFITSAEGKEFYATRKNLNSGGAIVVFDQTMDETDPDLYAWTLLAILEKVGLDDVNPSVNTTSLNIQVFWLKGGYDVFRQFDVNGDHRSEPGAFIEALNTTDAHGNNNSVDGIKLDANLLSRPAPMLSRSTTIPSSAPMNQSSNLQRRASLFSLDTGAARARREHSNRILRQASQRAASRAAANSLSESLTTSPESMNGTEGRKDDGMELVMDSETARHSSSSTGRQWSARSKDGGPDSAATHDSGFYTSSTVNSAASELPLPPYVNDWKDSDLDDMSEDIMSSDSPPVSCEETQFVVSEIVPGFLFVGSEITSLEHIRILQEKAVRRILNMAEECDDDVPGLQDTFIYKKIPARDTVDMRNVSSTFTGAVKFIGKGYIYLIWAYFFLTVNTKVFFIFIMDGSEDSKRLHEPIYVHCRAGKSRSVTAILAYLILSERWTLKRAYRHVTKARPNMSPNIGFVAELMKLEGRVHGMVSGIDSSDPSSMPLPSPKLKQDLKKLKQEWEDTVN